MHATRLRFLDHLRAERGASKHTVRAYDRTLTDLGEHLEGVGRTYVDARRIDVRAYLFRAGRGRAAATAARHVAAIRTFYAWLVDTGAVAESIADDAAPPPVGSHLPVFVSEAVAERVVEDGAASPRDRASAEVLYGAGLRVGELCALDRRDLDLHTGMVTVRRGKGGKERRVPCGPAAVDAVQRWLDSRGEAGAADGPLFVDRKGARIGDRTVRRLVAAMGR
ncbi:MAG: tyrosine-type recombinase/integrase, partial [Myxococcota bacterium]